MTNTVYTTEPMRLGTINSSYIKELVKFVQEKINEKIEVDFEQQIQRIILSNKEHNKKTLFFKRTTNADKLKKNIDIEVQRRFSKKRIEDFAVPFFKISSNIIFENKSVSMDDFNTLLDYVVYYGHPLSKDELFDKSHQSIKHEITNN